MDFKPGIVFEEAVLAIVLMLTVPFRHDQSQRRSVTTRCIHVLVSGNGAISEAGLITREDMGFFRRVP
jgi:hypothetical protein